MERAWRSTDGRDSAVRRIEAPADMELLAWLLDNSIPIPGTARRVGIDALIGLVPGLGDVISGGLGLLVVARAAGLGLPRIVLARMLANVALDFAIGSIPVIGDAFDLWYKANARNMDLLRRYLATPRAPTGGQWLFFGALLAGFLLVAALIVWVVAQLIGALFSLGA
jgi:hypothetical protein